ncbi:MAG: hypothetical protein H0T62_12090 [Parachlamydiaceae bacterium]|nr:hypothetical protein [Parachlamydiaceae bacterium]
MIKAKTNTSPKKMASASMSVEKSTSMAPKKAPAPVKKRNIDTKSKTVTKQKELTLEKNKLVYNEEPLNQSVGKRLQTAEGWKRSAIAKKASESRKTKKT